MGHFTVEITSPQQFDELVKSNKNVVADFWAPWCPPCRMAAPFFEQWAEHYKGIPFMKVNTDDNKDLSQRFHVTGIPIFYFFQDGEKVAEVLGFNLEGLKENLAKFLGPLPAEE